MTNLKIRKKILVALIINFSLKNRFLLILFLLLAVTAFLRFYQLDTRSPFGWDQVDNAWAVKNIIIDHRFPLVGMQAKLNSGIYIGPLYYYLLAVFYYFTNLDPVASGLFAGISSLVNALIIYWVLKNIFNKKVAFTGLLLNAVSLSIINFDRSQWPVNFIPTVSLILFYALYKVLSGNWKYLLMVGLGLGLAFNIHFTAIFYPIIILVCLPFIPINKKTVKYGIIAFLIFIFFLLPNIINEIQQSAAASKSMTGYLGTYSHGFHLRRMLQLAKDAFIEYEDYFTGYIKPFKYFLTPVFCLIYLKNNFSKTGFRLCYLIIIWFLVPWIAFSLYSGEITNYYFSMTRPIVIMIISYLTVYFFNLNNLIIKFVVVIFWFYFSYFNLHSFFILKQSGLKQERLEVLDKIGRGEKINFTNGDPKSYLYYLYTKK